MSVRSLNKVMLIGNLTRDPELRYTPNGVAVCTFGLATNRSWTTEAGDKKEEAEFHKIVSWNKLAELCSQLLVKGKKVYVEGRLQTRSWTGQDGASRTTTEIVIEDMIIVDSARKFIEPAAPAGSHEVMKAASVSDQNVSPAAGSDPQAHSVVSSAGADDLAGSNMQKETVNLDDIPF